MRSQWSVSIGIGTCGGRQGSDAGSAAGDAPEPEVAPATSGASLPGARVELLESAALAVAVA